MVDASDERSDDQSPEGSQAEDDGRETPRTSYIPALRAALQTPKYNSALGAALQTPKYNSILGAALQTIDHSAVITSSLGPALTRNLASTLGSIPRADLLGVWQEATSLSDDTSHTETVLTRLQVEVPSIPPAVLVVVVVCFVWLVSMGLLSAAAFENSGTAKEFIALTGLSPALVSMALAGWSGHAVKQWQKRQGSADDEV